LSVASKKGLLAAAGPDTIVVASTESVRKAYRGEAPNQDKINPLTPQVTFSVPRVSQLAFSSDETCLVITAEEGGGLAVYSVDSVLQNAQQPDFQMPTNGTSVRALIPNPAPDFAHLFAVVLADGNLMVANLKEKQLSNVFRDGVSCISWSAKGKQLVAGLEDGSAVQYDPQGNQKAAVPKPPQITSALPMTTILWVANDDFLTIHTPVDGGETDSVYHMLHRDKLSGSFTSQKLSGDPCPAFGVPRNPAQHFISRLRDFPPNLDDMFIISSTAAVDVGVVTKASKSLAADDMAGSSPAGSFTTTAMADDRRRAQMPMSIAGDLADTSPIGMALDLSPTETVVSPIPQEEIEESATPVPALMILNNEGLLCTWWVIYDDAIRQRLPYPGLTAISSNTAPTAQQSSVSAPQPTSTPSAFGAPSQQPAFGSSTFGKPAQPAFGSSTFGKPAQPTFGSSTFGQSAAPAFGSPSTPGSSAAFGKPAFGAPSTIASSNGTAGVFGASSGLGGKPSPWGTPAPAQSKTTPTFGQQSSPFGAFAKSNTSSLASLAANAPNKPAFASQGTEGGPTLASPFSSFQQPNKQSSFGSFGQTSEKSANSPQPSVGAKPSPWAVAAPASKEATMSDNDDDATDDESEKPTKGTTRPEASKSLFGLPSEPSAPSQPPAAESAEPRKQSPFAQLAGDKPKTSIFGQSSDKPSPFSQLGGNKANASPFAPSSDKPSTSIFGQPSAKPAGTSNTSPFAQFGKPSGSTPSVFKLGSTFKGDGSAKDDVPASKASGGSMFGSGFSNMLDETVKDKPKEPTTPIKTEPESDDSNTQHLSTTPASPEKSGDADDAPLPPDFVTQKPKEVEEDLPPIAGSPPVDLGSRSSQLSSPVSSIGGEEEDIGGPAEEEWEDENEDQAESEDEDEDDDEGEVEEEDDDDENDDEEESDQDDTISRPPKTAAGNAFGSRLTFPSQANGTAKSPVPSTTPAGFPKAPIFAPPSKIQRSPRSPSPLRQDRVGSGNAATRPANKQSITVPSLGAQHHPRPSSATPRPPPPPAEPEAGDLSDDEDARIQDVLRSEPEPTKALEPFVAHQDYIGHVSKPGIGGQIEKVYRDINSMIDTLGLNARSLAAFVKGHETMSKADARERSDLEEPDDWCLIETEDLGEVEKNLGDDLARGKVEDVQEKLDELTELYKDTTKLRGKTSDMRKQIVTRSDPQERANHRASALNTEAQMQQMELRQGVAKVQKLLQDAEEALTVLRASLASIPSTTQGASAQRAPTVEAVTNTILKMTAMIEQKSGDVDVLEAQIRRLPQGIAGLSLEDEPDLMRSSVRSLNGPSRTSGYGTPPRTRFNPSGSALGISGMLGSRYQTPQASRLSQSIFSLPHASEDSADLNRSVRSVRSLTGSTRKKMADVSSDEVQHHLAKQAQRKKVLAALKAIVEKKGTRVTTVEK